MFCAIPQSAEPKMKTTTANSIRRRGRHARREEDSTGERETAGHLQARDLLGENDECDDRGEERLQVRKQRRTRRADTVDRREPEEVRRHERAEHGEREPEPDE